MSNQIAELLYVSTPSYDPESIASRTETLIHSGLGFSRQDQPSDTQLFYHTRHVHEYVNGSISPQTAILVPGKRNDASDYSGAIQQSWGCDDAAERIAASTTNRLVTEMMAGSFDAKVRIELFHGILQAIVELTKPHGILFLHSEQVVAPADYLESCDEPPIERLGALNIRFYTIENSDAGDMLMDTRGLEEIGLHDLQCHFRDLDPNDVSRVLYNSALYIFENGPVIESGQTITGIEDDSMWQCQFEESLLDPARTVLDLNPGPRYAGGER